ncbi:hypothetical protein BIV25_13265 [Streptomyces sp. MUSC 14]|uniref:hypothetical protein n=1 Tax=Streptomyces sp. MUSC 14 TaxID=1354889 RepID=UPI0008F5877C|nr:hypothetical protein [Streptomyces sp. MUSC 14]OIJ97771.1 hypothetical protein BIV25_13265 [Streptomyces sp. MUSC 14]
MSASPPTRLHPVTARLPLVSRPHLHYPSLDARIEEVSACAAKSALDLPTSDRINAACATWNLSALIASDCGMPGYAEDLCLRQLRLFRQAQPITGDTAIAALQPLVNLIRLTARAGQKNTAYDQLTALHHAVHHGGPATVHGHTIDLADFTDDATRQHIRPWLRFVMLDDGTRLLASTAQWTKAAAHAAAYDDTPSRLTEARQTRAIAALADSDPDHAASLIDSACVTDSWETVVADVLRYLVRDPSASTTAAHYSALITAVESIFDQAPAHTRLFRTRLALTVIEMAPPSSTAQANLHDTVVHDVLKAEDFYAAREILRRSTAPASAPYRAQMKDIVRGAGLGAGRLPDGALPVIEEATCIAGDSLTRCLAQDRTPPAF